MTTNKEDSVKFKLLKHGDELSFRPFIARRNFERPDVKLIN